MAEENKEEITSIGSQVELIIPELPSKKNRSSFAEEEFFLHSNEDSKKRDHISVNTIPELDLLLMELSVLNKSETEKGTESLQFNNTVVLTSVYMYNKHACKKIDCKFIRL